VTESFIQTIHSKTQICSEKRALNNIHWIVHSTNLFKHSYSFGNGIYDCLWIHQCIIHSNDSFKTYWFL